jgi:hypothetical protein
MEPPGDSAVAAVGSSEDEDARRGVTPAAAAAAGTVLWAEAVDLSWTLLKAAAGEAGAAASAAALCFGLSGGVLMPGLVLNLPASKDTDGLGLTARGAAGAASAGAAGAAAVGAAGAEGDCCLGAGGGGGGESASSSSSSSTAREASPGDDLKREAEVTVCGLHRPTLARSPARYASRVPSRWAFNSPDGS